MAEGERGVDRTTRIISEGRVGSADFADLMARFNSPQTTTRIITEEKEERTVFVAYPYEFSPGDYRGAFAEVGEQFGVRFIYADEEITNKRILDKVTAMIQGATLSIFDITTWNPNVSLELGIAIGLDEEYFIFFNSGHDQTIVPTDIGGIDRVEYSDFASLKESLRRLMEQQFGRPDDREEGGSGNDLNSRVEQLRQTVPGIVAENPGIQMGGIASRLGVEIAMAQIIVRPLLEARTVVVAGRRRGARYYLPEDVPAEPEEKEGDTQGDVTSASVLP